MAVPIAAGRVAEPRPPNHRAALPKMSEASMRVRTRTERTLEAACTLARLCGKPLRGDGDFPGRRPPSNSGRA